MPRPGYRPYKKIKNFAEYRCTHVTHAFDDYWGRSDCPEEYWEENVQDEILKWVSGVYTWHKNKIYFEKSIDATIFSLRYPVKNL